MHVKLYVTLLFVNGITASENADYKLLYKTMKALNRTFDFILRDYKSMNLDGLWGVNFAQAYLTKALEDTIDSDVRKNLLLLKEKAKTIYALQSINVENSSWKNYVFINYVMSPEMWLHNIEFSYGKLNKNLKVFTGPYNVSNLLEYVRYILSNAFLKNNYSDVCIMEVATASTDRNPHNCPVNKTCYEHMIKMPKSYDLHFPGYGVTHMTLYLQIARARNCTFNKKQVDAMINERCSYILWELKKNLQFGYIPQLFDLFLEQIFVCGQEGFEEFLQMEYLGYVLREQNAHGGYGLILPANFRELSKKQRIKRDGSVMLYGANSHTTGLAVDVLALYIRFMLKKLFENKVF
ncbi:hypothetical protein ILUMI_11671 [Ignelater luminosus]|uniref:Uncharacterized protein n=1 Tax=Ignelater luminosus TaxID=2038154 RepID=A0A8K0G7I2_IGNLU|nr:hypothetical protein ILUMI_11671 [Ignelater luminosus]